MLNLRLTSLTPILSYLKIARLNRFSRRIIRPLIGGLALVLCCLNLNGQVFQGVSFGDNYPMNDSHFFAERCSRIDLSILEYCIRNNILRLELFFTVEETLNPRFSLYKSFLVNEDQTIRMETPIFGEDIISLIDLASPLEEVSWCEVFFCFSNIYGHNENISEKYTRYRISGIGSLSDTIEVEKFEYDSANKLIFAHAQRVGEYRLSLFKYKDGRVVNEKIYISDSPIYNNAWIWMKKPDIKFTFHYNSSGDLIQVYCGNDYFWSAEYDTQGRLLEETLVKDDVPIKTLQYAYDLDGKIKSVTDRRYPNPSLNQTEFVYYQLRYLE